MHGTVPRSARKYASCCWGYHLSLFLTFLWGEFLVGGAGSGGWFGGVEVVGVVVEVGGSSALGGW